MNGGKDTKKSTIYKRQTIRIHELIIGYIVKK